MSAQEEWLPVVGWEGLYEVSSRGRVKSLAREVFEAPGDRCPHGRIKRVPERILANCKRGAGYLGVNLSADGETQVVYVHALVCAAFIGPRPLGQDVAHNDGDKTNNAAENLRYATRAENNADKLIHGTASLGTNNGAAKLDDDDVNRIRAARGRTQTWLATEYGVSQSTISEIRHRKRWKHVSG